MLVGWLIVSVIPVAGLALLRRHGSEASPDTSVRTSRRAEQREDQQELNSAKTSSRIKELLALARGSVAGSRR